MSEEMQEGQKTIVSFIVGLLIGGLLVWAFSGPTVNAPAEEDKDKVEEGTKADDNKDSAEDEADVVTGDKGSEETTSTPVQTLPVGDGKVVVENQPASKNVVLSSATYPVGEGWIGVRDYQNEQLGGLLGVARFSEKQGLVPSSVLLQRATVAGQVYAVVLYNESGDLKFSLADDVQIDSIFATFTAQ